MNRWSEPGPGWDQIIHKHVVGTGYFWIPVIFSTMALVGAVRLTIMTTHARALWWPTSLGVTLLIIVAAMGAWRALKQYWAEPTEEANKQAFQKVRTLLYCGWFTMLGMIIVNSMISTSHR
jgi:uncharacterized membrane protein